MQGKYVPRFLEKSLGEALDESPAVAIFGPRQCGKSTLAKAVMGNRPNTVLLDLEKRADVARLSEPELFFDAHQNDLVCLDEIQRIRRSLGPGSVCRRATCAAGSPRASWPAPMQRACAGDGAS